MICHGASAFHDSLPWFLYDMRPQGFLGRGFVDAHPALRLPANLQHWNDDHILNALVNAGEDLPDNLVVGASAFGRFLSLPTPQRSRAPVVDNPATLYPTLAAQALGQTLAGSSAGGEQPKFSAARDGHPVHTLPAWPRARQLATRFWQRVADDSRSSAGFRAMALANAGFVPGL